MAMLELIIIMAVALVFAEAGTGGSGPVPAAVSVYINKIKSDTLVNPDNCDKVVKDLGGLKWLPLSSWRCDHEHRNRIDFTITKSINVFKESQMVQSKNGNEKVFILEKAELPRSAMKDGKTEQTGAQIWKALDLTETDELRTHQNSNEGEEITIDSTKTHVIEKLNTLYVFRKQ